MKAYENAQIMMFFPLHKAWSKKIHSLLGDVIKNLQMSVGIFKTSLNLSKKWCEWFKTTSFNKILPMFSGISSLTMIMLTVSEGLNQPGRLTFNRLFKLTRKVLRGIWIVMNVLFKCLGSIGHLLGIYEMMFDCFKLISNILKNLNKIKNMKDDQSGFLKVSRKLLSLYCDGLESMFNIALVAALLSPVCQPLIIALTLISISLKIARVIWPQLPATMQSGITRLFLPAANDSEYETDEWQSLALRGTRV